MVWLALPRLFAGLYLAGTDGAIERLALGEPVDEATYARLIAKHQAALEWIEDGAVRARLGAVVFSRARALGRTTPDGRAALERAIGLHRTALAAKPNQPFAWTRLAYALHWRDGAGAALDAPLTLAIQTGPNIPRLLLPRLELGLIVWPRLTDATRARLIGQAIGAARRDLPALAAAARARRARYIVRGLLAGEPDLQRQFEAAYRRQNG